MAISRVNVFELARRGAEIEGDLLTADLPRLPEVLRSAGAVVHFRFSAATDERGRPAASVTLAGSLSLICDLCGGAIAWPLRATRRYFFVASETALHALPIDVTEEEGLLGDDDFDLASLIEDDVILALPMAPRHDSCRIQHDAVAAANRWPTEESGSPRKNPFAALAAWSVGAEASDGGTRDGS